MRVVGWIYGSPNNESGAGYGIRISRDDRERYFDREWKAVTVDLDGQEEVAVNLSPSFWRSCIELRSKKIGAWMRREGLAPWPTGEPPELELQAQGEARFALHRWPRPDRAQVRC